MADAPDLSAFSLTEREELDRLLGRHADAAANRSTDGVPVVTAEIRSFVASLLASRGNQDGQRWAAFAGELRAYARHRPHCGTREYGPCTCGLEQVLAALAVGDVARSAEGKD